VNIPYGRSLLVKLSDHPVLDPDFSPPFPLRLSLFLDVWTAQKTARRFSWKRWQKNWLLRQGSNLQPSGHQRRFGRAGACCRELLLVALSSL